MPDLLYEVKETVAHITINREASRNSISREALALFLEHLDSAERDNTVRVVCITGAGERIFCSGADLGGIGNGSDPENLSFKNYAQLLTCTRQVGVFE